MNAKNSIHGRSLTAHRLPLTVHRLPFTVYRFTFNVSRFTNASGWLRLFICPLLLFAGSAAPSAAYETEWVSFPALKDFNGEAVELDALMFRPTGKGPFPALVLMHGCGGMYTRSGNITRSYIHWAELLAENGYVALLMDSFNPRGYPRICELQDRPIRESRERLQDAYAALRWFEKQAYVAKGRVGLLGWSNGGTGTLYAMRATQPYRGFSAAVAFYPGCRTLSRSETPYSVYAPTLILAGEADDWTPAVHCVALTGIAKKQGAPLEIVTYPGAHHSFDRINLPVRYRPDVRNLNKPGGRGATSGEHREARGKAIKQTLEFFAQMLREP
jgi:dienelactone hydrolase